MLGKAALLERARRGRRKPSRDLRTGSGRQAARMAPFKWVNTTLGNIKSAITGTYRKARPPIMPNATSPASPGDTTGATSSTP